MDSGCSSWELQVDCENDYHCNWDGTLCHENDDNVMPDCFQDCTGYDILDPVGNCTDDVDVDLSYANQITCEENGGNWQSAADVFCEWMDGFPILMVLSVI